MKRLEFIRFERVLPPIENNKAQSPAPSTYLVENDVMSGTSSEEGEEEEQIQLPVIETRILTKKEDDPPLVASSDTTTSTTKTTSLNKLHLMRKKKEQRAAKLPKPKPPPKSTTAKLPPLNETIKKQLKMALHRKRNTEIERPVTNKTPLTPHRKRANKASRGQSRRHKNKKRVDISSHPTPTVDESEMVKREIVVVEEVAVKEEANFLEVDLGTDHFVQQIVLEVCSAVIGFYCLFVFFNVERVADTRI